MGVGEAARDALVKGLAALQRYAADYFILLYSTIIPFWRLPSVPAGANILTGAFATLLIYTARFVLTQPTNVDRMGLILVVMLFYTLLICGILIIFDRRTPTTRENFSRLVSVVCVGVTLGCGLISLDRPLPWIGYVYALANWFDWNDAGANRLVAVFSAFGSTAVIFANTLRSTAVWAAVTTMRLSAWTLIVFAVTAFGISLVLVPV